MAQKGEQKMLTPIERARERATAIETDGSQYDKQTAALFRDLARDLEVALEVIKDQRKQLDQWENDYSDLQGEC
jgi:hypothetical protein